MLRDDVWAMSPPPLFPTEIDFEREVRLNRREMRG